MKVLFICSGNVFRSMSADFCLKDYLKKNAISGIEVTSAGTHANPEEINPTVIYALEKFGIDCTRHQQKRLDRNMLEMNDVIVCMADYHQDFILENFGNFKTFLFNEICFGKKESVWDVEDVIMDWNVDKAAVMEHEIRTVEHIHNSMPSFVKNISKYIKK
jgi:protein-tyrosine phosphatase